MKREGLEKILSEAVSAALGVEIRLTSPGRASDGRFNYVDRLQSECHVCVVPFLKERTNWEFSMPCEPGERSSCRVRRVAEAITVFGSARAVEDKIETQLRSMGIASEASLGRGSANNMSIILKIGDQGRARLTELKNAAKRIRDQQKTASTLAKALDVLTPATTP
jgi:hypothetical protein